MGTPTTYLALNKPASSDVVNVQTALDNNYDLIDAQFNPTAGVGHDHKALGGPVARVSSGLLAARPVAGLVAGQTYFATDSGDGTLYTYTGAAWRGTPTIKRVKAVDQIVNNSAVLVNDADLVFNVGATDVWSIYMVLYVTGAIGLDVKIAFTGPTVSENLVSYIYKSTGGVDTVNSSGLLNAGISSQATATGRQIIMFGHYFGQGTPRTIQLQWAQNVAGVSDTKMKAGSFILATQIA